MDDSVFSSQFQAMRDSFAQAGITIDVAYTPSGRVDYLYETGRLLVQRKNLTEVTNALPGAVPVPQAQQPTLPSVQVLTIDRLHNGYLTVPQAMDVLRTRLKIGAPVPGQFPIVSPVHIMHVCNGSSPDTVRTCPATEPEVPPGCEPGQPNQPNQPNQPCAPYPPIAPTGGLDVKIGICDSGLLANITAPWLDPNQVTGDPDPLGPRLTDGLDLIPRYCGHGTFVAGVARAEAPQATVHVTADFVMSGGEREWMIVQQLQTLAGTTPTLINLSAGTYTSDDWPLMSFLDWQQGGIPLVAAAGNDATDRPFWPAAFDWVVGVGALGADQRNRAWFSNYGPWVDVYTLGEGLVNAFATGQYTYLEPPKRPAQQVFAGMARWSGTSFAAPLVAGLIAAQITNGVSPAAAIQAVLAKAASQTIHDVVLNRNLPVLYPWHP